ncbi:AAA family ATPase [Entomospira nematocerorum]|uniref:AAA domain-containing protein n=1 Tax=Entomospira nematocerorum TaxID=2719987 RepID=A0A968KU25_9SPIO|nr:AAA family ATPase [Entomospira nematocera]NIZ46804.1 AAA domain-containing protein [Entomospira nematocera]WDI33399.1 AAA family ATPase [Entomospira nematocera]
MSKTLVAHEEAIALIQALKAEMSKKLVAQDELVLALLTGLLTSGHVLIEGAPGLAKTLAVSTLCEIANLDFKRIQFTPDLLPADIVGTMVYNQSTGEFTTKRGTIFANLILADEINRAPAKVQSALLEAMAERQVTIGDTTHLLPNPFLVLATQNPIEQEGAYRLPEAQLDRFLIKAKIHYPTAHEELTILRRMGIEKNISVEKILDKKNIDLLKEACDAVRVDEAIEKYIVSIIVASRSKDTSLPFTRLLDYGASPRATLSLYRVAKARALFEGRDFVLPEDVKMSAYPVLRHRLILSYDAEAEELDSDAVISSILSMVAVP